MAGKGRWASVGAVLAVLAVLMFFSGVFCGPAEAAPAETAPAAPPEGNRQLIEQLISQGMLDDAVAAYRRGPVTDVLIKLGEALKRSGRGLEMLELYRGLLLGPANEEAGPFHDSSGLGLARQVIDAIVEVGHGQETEKLLLTALAGRALEAQLHLRLGYLRWRMGDRRRALEEFDKYAALVSKVSASWLGWVAMLCKEAGLTDQAMAYYGRALKAPITDDDLRARAMMSSMHRSAEVIRSEIRADLLMRSAELHRAAGRLGDAEKCYKDALELKPPVRVEAIQLALSQVWKAMGKDNALVRQLTDELRADAKNADTHARLAKLLLAIGQKEEGIEHYRQAAALAPNEPAHRLALADALAKAGNHAEALAEYALVLRAAAAQDQPRGRLDAVGPETVLGRLRQFDSPPTPGATAAAPTDLRKQLLRLYGEALHMHPPATKWEPSDYVVRDLVQRMSAILAGQSDYQAVVNLWLDNRGRIGSSVRDEVVRHVGRLDSLDGVIGRLRLETKDNKADIEGMFILGDVLRAAGKREQAMKTYAELSAGHAGDQRVHLDLAARYLKIDGQEKLALAEYQAALAMLPAGSEEHTRIVGTLARVNLRLGDKDAAAKLFREALQRDPGNDSYLRGLKEAGGQATVPTPPAPAPAAAPDDDAKLRAQAKQFLLDGEYAKAIGALRQIISRRPTDVEAITLLGQAHLKAGQEKEAIEAFRKAHEMRRWSSTDYGARSELVRLLENSGADYELVTLYEQSGDYGAIRNLYRRRKQPDKFTAYLNARLAQRPDDIELRLLLAEDYLDGNSPKKARPILEQLRRDLSEGAAVNRQRLSDCFERLGEPVVALELLDAKGFAESSDSNDWLGTRLMRLLSKTNQMSEAMGVCLVRLRNDPDGYRTLQIAQEIVAYSQANKSVELLNEWLKGLEGKIPSKIAQRFIGAVSSCLRVSAPAQDAKDKLVEKQDPVAALKRGRIVPVPANAGTLLDYLNALAASADTAVDQSFRDMARQLPAPKPTRTRAPVLELLAEALNGLPASLAVSSEGFWAVLEHGDPSTKACCAASGGALLWLSNNGVYRRGGGLAGMGKLILDPNISPALLATDMSAVVKDAADDSGRKLTSAVAAAKHTWGPVGLSFYLPDPSGKAKAVSALKLVAHVAMCTKWITLESAALKTAEPIVMKDPAATVTITPPLAAEPQSDRPWSASLAVEWSVSSVRDPFMRSVVHAYLLLADGTRRKCDVRVRKGHGSDKQEFTVTAAAGRTFSPADARLVVLLPGAAEVVPIEFTLKDVPVLERSGAARKLPASTQPKGS